MEANPLNEISNIKLDIDKLLLSDPQVVSLVMDQMDYPVPAINLKYVRVYPFKYVPSVTEEANTYITYQVKIRGIGNPALAKYRIYFYIFTHQSKERIDDEIGSRIGIEDRGVRTDILASKIDSLINGNANIGIGRVELIDSDEITAAPRFAGRYLIYDVYGWNRTGAQLT